LYQKQGFYPKRVLHSSDVFELVDKGWKKADMHVHTCCSPDVPAWGPVHPQLLYDKAVSKGMDYVTFTDHDTIDAFDLLDTNEDTLVTGVELSITDTENVGHTIHINVFELDKEQFNAMDYIASVKQNIFELIDFLKESDLPYMYNHPFWFAAGENPNLSVIPEIAKHFPLIEYNIQDLKQKNQFAMSLAQRLGKGMAITTDSHTGNIGAAYTIAKGDDFREYFKNICRGNSYLVTDHPLRRHLSKELSVWVELAFNTDKQVDLDFVTNVEKVNKAMRILGSDIFSNHPMFTKMVMKSIQKLSLSGLPSLLYVLSMQPMIYDIKSVIGR
jgi:predicted metal-dependent phosphoesterase TrpH